MIALDSLDHLIRSPCQFHADYVTGSLIALHIAVGDDRHQIVRFADPIADAERICLPHNGLL